MFPCLDKKGVVLLSKYSLVLLSGGIGKRMQINIPKQFLLLAGKPIFIHVLEKIEQLHQVEEVVMPCPVEFMEKTESIITEYGFHTPIKIIEGGSSRQESVYFGLLQCTNEQVIIHEAVRPFITVEGFQTLVNEKSEDAIFGLDIPFTVLKGKEFVEENLERSQLINVQLPHKYNTSKLLYAHECARQDSEEFTEDASLYFHYFQSPIAILEGFEENIKITKPIDRIIAEAIYKNSVYMEG